MPFRPVLRGKLLTGDESLSMSTDVAGGGGEGVASPTFCGGRPTRSAPATWRPCCTTVTSTASPSRPVESLDVEVALPKEWHEEPMALDPNEPPKVD